MRLLIRMLKSIADLTINRKRSSRRLYFFSLPGAVAPVTQDRPTDAPAPRTGDLCSSDKTGVRRVGVSSPVTSPAA